MDQLKQNFSQNLNNLEYYEQFLLKNYKRCPLHPRKQLCSLVFSENQKQYLKCLECIFKCNKNSVALIDILESDEKTIFEQWPQYEDSQILIQLQDISKRQQQFFKDTQDSAKNYFQNLKQKVDQIISNYEKQYLFLIEKAWQMNEDIIHQYNDSICKNELKDLLLNKHQNYKEQNQLLSTLINQVIDNKQSINNTLKTLISELNKILKKISDPNYSKIQNLIAKNIQQLDLLGNHNSFDNEISSISNSDEESELSINKNQEKLYQLNKYNHFEDKNNKQKDNDQNNSNKDQDDDEDDSGSDRCSFMSTNSRNTGDNTIWRKNNINRVQRNYNSKCNSDQRRENQNQKKVSQQIQIINLGPNKSGQDITGQIIEFTVVRKKINYVFIERIQGRIADDTANIMFDIQLFPNKKQFKYFFTQKFYEYNILKQIVFLKQIKQFF
ncbi:hypothetical protein ABPG72_014562 [Tetrahymena utriculariae]